MIVPATNLQQKRPDNPVLSGLNGTHLLMAFTDAQLRASAEYQQQESLKMMDRINKMVDPKKFDDAVRDMPESTSIDDRRTVGKEELQKFPTNKAGSTR